MWGLAIRTLRSVGVKPKRPPPRSRTRRPSSTNKEQFSAHLAVVPRHSKGRPECLRRSRPAACPQGRSILRGHALFNCSTRCGCSAFRCNHPLPRGNTGRHMARQGTLPRKPAGHARIQCDAYSRSPVRTTFIGDTKQEAGSLQWKARGWQLPSKWKLGKRHPYTSRASHKRSGRSGALSGSDLLADHGANNVIARAGKGCRPSVGARPAHAPVFRTGARGMPAPGTQCRTMNAVPE